jgi:TonB family protein
MKMRAMLMVAALAVPASAGAESSTLEQLIESIPIHAVPSTPEMRKRQRDAGERVLLVEGRPSPIYRDFLTAMLPISGMSPVSAPVLHMPQENPDVNGCVTISFQIRADGKTDAFEVMKSEPKGLFDKQALRAVHATEYETAAEAGLTDAAAEVRHERSIWFLVARPPRAEFSKVNEVVERSRNRKREEQRAACENAAK